MSEYDEFRLVMSPRPEGGPPWSVYIDECPPGVPAHLLGAAGSVPAPALSRADLASLRAQAPWPNSALLKQIGQRVWGSIMTTRVADAFRRSRATATARGRGLRVTLVSQGDVDVPTGQQIALCELPIEVLYDDIDQQYVAVQPATTVSRRPYPRPDAGAVSLDLPLCITVVVSTPNLLGFDAEKELDVIKTALESVSDRVRLDIVRPATREAFRKSLAKGPHVVHFIGHGGFDAVGEEGTPVGYLAFMKDNGDLDPVDAEQFEAFFSGTNVRLVVLTACASAAPMPPQSPYPLTAMDGVAQRLVGGGGSAVSAVVAMQFDLEQNAAVAFAAGFYESLLDPACALDEAVTRARTRVRLDLPQGTAHRAWVTPTLYWRARGSRVFELLPSLSPADQAQVDEIVRATGTIRGLLGEVRRAAVAEIPGYMLFSRNMLGQVASLAAQRASLVKRALRAEWLIAKAGSTASLRLYLHASSAAPVGALDFTVAFPPETLALTAVTGEAVLPVAVTAPAPVAPLAVAPPAPDPAAGAPLVVPAGGAPLAVAAGPAPSTGVVAISLRNDAPLPWIAGEALVARLSFQVTSPDGRPSLADIDLRNIVLTQGGATSACDDIDGAIIIDPTP